MEKARRFLLHRAFANHHGERVGQRNGRICVKGPGWCGAIVSFALSAFVKLFCAYASDASLVMVHWTRIRSIDWSLNGWGWPRREPVTHTRQAQVTGRPGALQRSSRGPTNFVSSLQRIVREGV